LQYRTATVCGLRLRLVPRRTKLCRKIRKRIVARMGNATNVLKYLSGESEGKKPNRRLGVMGIILKRRLQKRRKM